MENKKLVVANLKMYLSTSDIATYLKKIASLERQNVIFCPTSIYLPYFVGHGYGVGIQNVAATELGAYTGEVSAIQAAGLGVQYAILGHSERRQYFGETNAQIHQKIIQCLRAKMTPIVCIGETAEEYQKQQTKEVLKQQIIACFRDLPAEAISKVIIAYEPIWAIGTGKIPRNEEITEIASEIKHIVVEKFHCHMIPVLYGGSIKCSNIEQLENIKNIDGYLIGKASTTEEFFRLLEVVYYK